MPPDRGFVERALADLENTLRFLRTQARRPEVEFTASLEACYSSAYALITAIETLAAIASHLIATCGFPAPKGMSDAFEELFRQGVIREIPLRDHLVSMSRFRNLLVHRYWAVDYSRVYRVLCDHLEDFGAFARDVLAYLDRPVA